jgi:hypothetical protein
MYQRKNFAYGKVATAPSPAASGTSLTLETGQGARFPNTSGGTYICVVKQTNLPATPDNAEVVLVTSHDPANDNFTIDRAEEGSGARTVVTGDEFYLSPTDGVWDQLDVLTTKGDLLSQSAAGVYARLAVGTNTYLLSADSGETTGLKWIAQPTFDSITVTAAPDDHVASGLKITLTAHENVAFGDVCYINASGEAALIDADSIATMTAIVMATATINADASGVFLMMGIARDDSWAWTVGGTIYGTVTGTSGNTLSQTMPTGTDDVVQILGVATHADRMFFNPQLVQIEHT